ncbi:hypothetical protein BJX68DRAFT_185014 [Aspergillus pseudodeflectus]|uniref:Zn(2)-C6 fungal-type domain-containing protein n=1 Tax=Aspergillus pseudodeflectus TaxID=176178 RepID=A0ABR4JL42_9EURO
MSQNGSDGGSVNRVRRARVERGKRSRNGCSTCISKRVKCDEARPYCERCVRLHLTCEWRIPKPSLTSRRRGFGPIKDRDSSLWSPSSIVPKADERVQAPESTMTPESRLPSPTPENRFQLDEFLAEDLSGDDYLPLSDVLPVQVPQDPETPWEALAISTENDSSNSLGAFGLLRAPVMGPFFAASDLSFAYATGFTPALGSDDKQAASFHCKVLAPLKSTRNWACSAHTLFLNKVYNRDMALHFLLAVSHSELAIYYGRGSQPPRESQEHFERGSHLFLQAHNPFASPDHVGMMLSFLYMYMFWMRRDRLDPMKLKDLSRAVLAYVRTYGLDTLCASDDVGTCSGMITASEQVLLARVIIYLYDRDGFCCFFGCGGDFANFLNSDPRKRRRIWLRSRTAFLLSSESGSFGCVETEMDDAATLDVYFELITLHQEINAYSQASATQSTIMESRLQQQLETIHKEYAPLFHRVTDPKCHSQCTLMAFVAVAFYYALQIYYHRARLSSFGTRPLPTRLQNFLTSLVSTAYYAVKAGPMQLLERFQWSLFIAALETTDPVHKEWIGNSISDPAIKAGFDHIKSLKEESHGSITMHMIRSLIDEGFQCHTRISPNW